MFTLPPLPYDYSALEPFIDTETMKVHHDKHHQAYVDNLNKIITDTDLENKTLEELFADPRTKNMAGGVLNHNFFWQVMQPAKKEVADEKRWDLGLPVIGKIINKFGGLAKFEEQFTTAALGIFGSGWCWLTSDLKIITTPNQDIPDGTPILGLDVWEHAYYLKYQNRRAEYIKNWWNVVNWEEVEKRLDESK